MRKLPLTAGAFLLLLPGHSQAHIKWFCAYDTTVPPLPISDVLTPTFAAVAILFCSLMFVAYVVDRAVNASDWAKRLDNSIFRSESCTNTIIRAAVGILFLVLWDTGGIILTPELKTTSTLVPLLQLAIAASMLFRSTLKFGAIGIMALYVYAVAGIWRLPHDGLPDLPGCGRLSLPDRRQKPATLCALRLPVLYTGVAVTMMWGAIEKFGYPYWTFPLLATHPGSDARIQLRAIHVHRGVR